MTRKQKLFIQYYTDFSSRETYLNATQSGLKAGYKETSIRPFVSKLLKKAEIKATIDNIMVEDTKRVNKSKEDFLKELSALYTQAKRDSDKIRLKELEAKILGLYRENETKIQTALFTGLKEELFEKKDNVSRVDAST